MIQMQEGPMTITKELFAAYLNCQTKAYLKNSAMSYEQSKFGMWRSNYENGLREQGLSFLQKQSRCKTVEKPTAADFLTEGSALYVNCYVKAEQMEAVIDAIEKIEQRGKRSRWLPYRCRLDRRDAQYGKLLLAFDALCLQTF